VRGLNLENFPLAWSIVEDFRTLFEAGDHDVIEMVAGLRHLAELVGHQEKPLK
jgi:hypothetical protein